MLRSDSFRTLGCSCVTLHPLQSTLSTYLCTPPYDVHHHPTLDTSSLPHHFCHLLHHHPHHKLLYHYLPQHISLTSFSPLFPTPPSLTTQLHYLLFQPSTTCITRGDLHFQWLPMDHTTIYSWTICYCPLHHQHYHKEYAELLYLFPDE